MNKKNIIKGKIFVHGIIAVLVLWILVASNLFAADTVPPDVRLPASPIDTAAVGTDLTIYGN